jgi:hypothetical protein
MGVLKQFAMGVGVLWPPVRTSDCGNVFLPSSQSPVNYTFVHGFLVGVGRHSAFNASHYC